MKTNKKENNNNKTDEEFCKQMHHISVCLDWSLYKLESKKSIIIKSERDSYLKNFITKMIIIE